MTINYLFVYGTLKPGKLRHYYLNRIHGTWSDAYCYGNWINNIDIGYPVISLDNNGEKIKGKLFFSKQLKNILRQLIHMRAVNTKDQLLMYILKMDHLLSPIFMKLKIKIKSYFICVYFNV